MSSIEAMSSLGNLPQTAQTAGTSPDTSNAPVQTSATLSPDVVTLSMSGQAKLMHQQGNSPTLIASNLGINVADVDGYLGITVAVATAATPVPSEAIKTATPEATVPASPAPQPVTIKAPTAES